MGLRHPGAHRFRDRFRRCRERIRMQRVMRIHSVEAIPVSYPEPNDFNALRHLCLCKITTDDGCVGWGESITQFPEANFAVKAVIEGMAENLTGRDPAHTEALWRQCKDQAWW